MKKALLFFFAIGLVSVGLSSAAHAGSGSICEQNPDAPNCQRFPGK